MAKKARPAAEAESPASAADGVDPEAIRQRAYELALLHPDTTAEENWLLAEAELLSAASKRRSEDEHELAEAAADLRAKIDMAVYGHS